MQAVAIITGAGRGIGRATAGELARRGYRLTLVARTEKELQETNREFARGDALVAPCDVTDPVMIERVVAQTGAMSILSVAVQLYAEPAIIAIVPAGAFYPAPKVDSVGTSMTSSL